MGQFVKGLGGIFARDFVGSSQGHLRDLDNSAYPREPAISVKQYLLARRSVSRGLGPEHEVRTEHDLEVRTLMSWHNLLEEQLCM